MVQPGAAHYLQQQQQQQQQQMTQQSLMAARSSMLYSQQPYASLQQQQAALHGQLSMNPGGAGTGLNILQSESSHHSGGGGFHDFGRGDGLPVGGRGLGGSKHEMGSSSSADGRGGSSGSGDGGETLYLKSTDEGN